MYEDHDWLKREIQTHEEEAIRLEYSCSRLEEENMMMLRSMVTGAVGVLGDCQQRDLAHEAVVASQKLTHALPPNGDRMKKTGGLRWKATSDTESACMRASRRRRAQTVSHPPPFARSMVLQGTPTETRFARCDPAPSSYQAPQNNS